MKTVGVITQFDVDRSPRPKRFSACLSELYKVTIIGPGECKNKNLNHIAFDLRKKRSLIEKIINLVNLLVKNYEPYLRTKYSNLSESITGKNFDVIIVHDLEVLPIVVNINVAKRIIFDAREYFPLHYESSFSWRLLFKGLNHYLCLKYLKQVDQMLTVSPGLLEKYEKEYKKRALLIESWPDYADISPGPIGPKIRLIYHGGANTNRKLELMIMMMDYLDDRFTLDLMLVGGSAKYLKYLKSEASKRPSVSIIEPVRQKDIVSFTAGYDIGIFICPPTTFNLKHALPNKLFEYIQSRLMLAISPSEDMARVVNKYELGIISEDFTPKAMANKLNKITKTDIEHYKNNANNAAKILNAEKNCIKIREIVSNVL